ncbi:PREDICTED: dnaJ homolog subfamily C member 22 [Lepidothrix coronata]|uniref:DnaJ homolog subfamily C member 22 n=1 Tax=Lepidothrix coronata TaxID=321398 RepID=A0A6J0J5D3_9PASS|nr:PREDICTED: dnaJ homolog subfamily C member 22 [Lepidothrix coronata]
MAKSLVVALGLWALGGLLGLHHLYLGRDRHALLWILTLGGFGAGWLWDLWHLPGWVATANGPPRPPTSGAVPTLSPPRVVGQLLVGAYFGLVVALGVPWVPPPLAVALGVLLVASVGDQGTNRPRVLVAAFLSSLLFQGGLLPTSLATTAVAAWHRRFEPPQDPPPPLSARLCHLGLGVAAFGAPLAWGGVSGALGVAGTILMLPLRVGVLPLRAGWALLEGLGVVGGAPEGSRGGAGSEANERRRRALEVLGLRGGCSAEDVQRSYRELVKLWHPDHNRHRAREAERRFIELQEAYEELAGPRRAVGG